MGDPQRHVGVDPLTAEAHICISIRIRILVWNGV